jgi:endonuclease YncB( thermonuclease family)
MGVEGSGAFAVFFSFYSRWFVVDGHATVWPSRDRPPSTERPANDARGASNLNLV